MFRKILRKIPGFRPPKDIRKALTSGETYIVFLRVNKKLYIIDEGIRKVGERYHFKFRNEKLAVLVKHDPMFWKDRTVISVNATDLTNAPFMEEDKISGKALEKYEARAIRWCEEHCAPLICDQESLTIKETVIDEKTYLMEGEYKEGEIYGYDMEMVSFEGFDPMVVSNKHWWTDNFNFAQELEDNRLFQFLAIFSLSTWERIKLFLQDMGVVLLIILLVSVIAPDVIRIGKPF